MKAVELFLPPVKAAMYFVRLSTISRASNGCTFFRASTGCMFSVSVVLRRTVCGDIDDVSTT